MSNSLNCRSRWSMIIAAVGAVLLGFPCSATPVRAQSNLVTEAATGDVTSGWRIFHEKGCADCHAIWGQGGRKGPDLGRTRTGRLFADQLAGVMWNHIPKMLGRMKYTGRAPSALSRDEMTELFSLLVFVRQLEEQGIPRRGEQILRSKGCTECHTIDTTADGIGPDLAKWGEYLNPIAWAQMMWEHAPIRNEAMGRSGTVWPELEGSDLIHIVAFVRSMGVSTSSAAQYLRPGSVIKGKQLFLDKACDTCHPGAGPDLGEADLPSSFGALAARMWDHSPAMMKVMREQDVKRRPITPQQLADILAYVHVLDPRNRMGDALQGKVVFGQKGCVQCHEREGMPDAIGPAVTKLSGSATGVAMATAMWNHSTTILKRGTEVGLSWAVFNDKDMLDLLAYLRTLTSATGAGDAANLPVGASGTGGYSGTP